VLAGALVVFGLVTLDVLVGGPLTRVDSWVSDRSRSLGAGPAFDLLTTFGEHAVVALVVGGCLAVVARRRRSWEPLVRFAVLGAATVAAVLALKVGIGRQPPSGVDPALPWRSYPSGHTVTAVVLWGLLASVVPGRLTRTLAWLGPVLVMVGMVLRDYHWTTDLVGGAALGVVLLRAEGLALGHWRGAGGGTGGGAGPADRGAAPAAPRGGG
jgi:membrane-associated phospholipid phosphatase